MDNAQWVLLSHYHATSGAGQGALPPRYPAARCLGKSRDAKANAANEKRIGQLDMLNTLETVLL